MLPRVSWLRTPPLSREGLRCAVYHTAPDPASQQGRAPECRVSYGSESCLPIRRAPVPPPHALQCPVGRESKA
jgi:hypothetical protein